MAAHVVHPPLSPPSARPPELPSPDPGAASHLAPESGPSLLDPEACPESPLQEEDQEGLLYRVLTVNAVTRKQAARPEVVIPRSHRQTVALPYADQLAHPEVEVTHELDSAERLEKLI